MTSRQRRFVLLTGGGAALACAAMVPFLARWAEEARCLRALEGPGWKEAAATLGRLGSERAVPRLFELLPRDENVPIEDDAAGKALLAIGRPAFQFAVAALREDTKERRWNARRVLVYLPAEDARILIEAARGPDVAVRAQVTDFLAVFLSDPVVMAAYMRLLEDPSADVQRAAILSARDPPDCLAAPLLRILQDSEQGADLRRCAALGVSWLRPALSVPALRAALRSTDALVRAVAAERLGGLEGKRGREAIADLEPLLHDADLDVRLAALGAFGDLGATAACLEPAIELLESDTSGSAAGVLSQLGAAAAPGVPALIRVLERFPAKPGFYGGPRFAAIEALGRIGPAAKAAVPVLQRELADETSTDRTMAALALGRIGPAALEGGTLLVELGLRDKGDEYVDALALLGTAAVPAVIRFLTSQDFRLRTAAAEHLGDLGAIAGPPAVTALTAALSDDYPDPAEKAAWALGRFGPAARSAGPALITLLKRTLDEAIACDPDVIAEALGRIGIRDEPVPALLRRVAKIDFQQFRPQALLALGRLGIRDDATLKLLREGLVVEEGELERYCSAHALLHLGIRDAAVETALAASHGFFQEELHLVALRLHAGFPEETRRILPQCVEWLGQAGAGALGLLAKRLAEVGAEAQSTLPALRQAKAKLLKEQEDWASNPFDSGGSHLERQAVDDDLEALQAAIETISRGNEPSAEDG